MFQENFGEHIKANACSWSNDAQLWQVVNTTWLAHVTSGRCPGTANDGSCTDGTWLIVSLCTGRDDQKWRIARQLDPETPESPSPRRALGVC